MADQTTLNGARRPPARALANNMAGLAHDVTTLGELQAKLLAADLKESTRRLIAPTVLSVVGVVVLLGCVPVLIEAFAVTLMVEAEFSRQAAMYLAVAGGAVLSIVMVLAAVLLFRKSFTSLRRSQEEFATNLQWLKDVLKHCGGSS